MRARLGVTALFAVWFGVAGCNLLRKPGGDDGGGASTTTATTAATTATAPSATGTDTPTKSSGPSIANESEVRRYGDEVAINNQPLTVKGKLADVVKEAGATTASTLIATLKKDTQVTGIANTTVQGKQFTLVTFDDPSDSGVTLEGWVNHDSFGPATKDAGVNKRRTCGGGQVAIVTADSDTCVTACSSAVPCPSPNLTCKGDGFAENADGSPGAGVTFCIAQAPPPPPVDASVPPPASASASASASTPASASGTPPAASSSAPPQPPKPVFPTVIRVSGVPLGCPGNYAREGMICRLRCQVDADCAGTGGSQCQATLCNP
jgi:hypothetical protein